MPKFKVAVSWECFGEVTIDAPTLEDAIRYAKEDDGIPLPEGDYVDGSFRVDAEMSEELNK